MLIEMWTDFACPFCYIGKRRLEDALRMIDEPVEVIYRSYELDPTSPKNVGKTIYESFAAKYGMSLEQAKANCDNITMMAHEVGLDFHFDTHILTNTFDAHRLTMFAKTKGLMKEMTDCILRVHFTESKHIGDVATLVELAADIGLERDEVKDLLESDRMSDAVRADEKEAAQLGIRSVPFFLMNKKYALTGAQPIDVFVQAIRQVIEKDGPFNQAKDNESLFCNENGCDIPSK